MRWLAAVAVVVVWCGGAWAEDGKAGPTKSIGIGGKPQQNDAQQPVAAPNAQALIIGCGQFTDPRIPELQACANDARLIAKTLTAQGRGLFAKENVRTLIDAEVTRENVVTELTRLSRLADEDTLVMIFFSGHGTLDAKKNAYWVMHNTSLDVDSLRASAFEEGEISDLLSEIKSKRLVVWIDACYSAATAHLGGTKVVLPQGRQPEFVGEGRVRISSSKGDQLSVIISDPNEKGHGHSVFTWYLNEALLGLADTSPHDGFITLQEAWSVVRDEVPRTSRRYGGEQQPTMAGEIAGRLVVGKDQRVLDAQAEAEGVRQALAARRIKALEELYDTRKIEPQHYRDGSDLLAKHPHQWTDAEKKDVPFYERVADGKSPPEDLARLVRLPRERVGPTQLKIRNRLMMEFVLINPGNFTMGRAARTMEERAESLDVAITQPFYLGMTEVTRGQFEAFVEATGYTTTAEQDGWSYGLEGTRWKRRPGLSWRSPGFAQGEGHPVVCISWRDAVAFCRWLSEDDAERDYRLPTEAEWEYASRGGLATTYAWGEDLLMGQEYMNGFDQNTAGRMGKRSELSWTDDYLFTAPVTANRESSWGLKNMTGNVWEWCADWYAPLPKRNSRVDNWHGPGDDEGVQSKVLRGGSWYYYPGSYRADFRLYHPPGHHAVDFGFRLVCEVSR